MIYIKYHSDLLPSTSYDFLLYMTTLSCKQHLVHIKKQLYSLMRCKNNKTKTQISTWGIFSVCSRAFSHNLLPVDGVCPQRSHCVITFFFFSQDSTFICFGVFKNLFNTTLTTCWVACWFQLVIINVNVVHFSVYTNLARTKRHS